MSPENLFCKDQKAATDKYRENYDAISWGEDEEKLTPQEVADLIEKQGGLFLEPRYAESIHVKFTHSECKRNPFVELPGYQPISDGDATPPDEE